MNHFLKLAYEAGVQQAMQERGLEKQADLSAGELMLSNLLLGSGPLVAGLAAPKDRGWSRFGWTGLGALGGSIGGGALGGLAGLLSKNPRASSLGVPVGLLLGGLGGQLAGHSYSRSQDPLMVKLLRERGVLS